MRSTSADYKRIKAQDGSWFEVNVVVGNTTYGMDDLKTCRITQGLFTKDAPTVGGTVATQCELTLLEDKENWPRGAEFEVRVRVWDKTGTEHSEWLTLGTFYTDTRVQYASTLEIYGLDAMLQTEQSWIDKIPDADFPTTWPITAKKAVDLICDVLDLTLDSRTTLDNTVAFVGLDETLTARDVLASVAAAMGGNFRITPEGKLLLVPLAYNGITPGSAAIAGIAIAGITIVGDTTPNTSGGGSVTDWVYVGADQFYLLETGVPLPAVHGVCFTAQNGTKTTTGSNYVLNAICDFSDSSAASLALTQLDGYIYKPFSVTRCFLDPAVEIGDVAYIDTVSYQIITAVWTLGKHPSCTFEAPFEEEQEHEYPVQDEVTKALRTAEQAIDKEDETLRTLISQTASDITLEVSQTYATKTELENAVEALGKEIQITADPAQMFTRAAGATDYVPSSITLTATHGGTMSSYLWYKNNVSISTASSQTFTVTPSDITGNAATFKVVGTDSDGNTYTDAMTLAKLSDGESGIGVDSVTVSYASTSLAPSSVDPAQLSWQSTIPSVADGDYLWTRTVTDYTDSSVPDTVTYTYSRQGEDGQAGSSITVRSIRYQEGTSPTTPPTGTWRTSPPSVAQGNYLWTKTTFSDNSVAYGVARQGENGTNGTDGEDSYTAMLDNEYVEVPVTSARKPVASVTFSCVVSVYKGITAMTATNSSTLAEGEFKVATGTAPTGVTVAQSTAGTITLGFDADTAIDDTTELALTISVYGGFTINTRIAIHANMNDVTVSNTAAITVNADKISLVVTGTGSNMSINTASIVTSINNSGSSVTIEASKIKLSGTVMLSSWLYSGSTTIDGSKIQTGTIDANRITAGTITATQIHASTITADRIVDSTITGGKIAQGTIASGNIISVGGSQVKGGTINAAESGSSAYTSDCVKITNLNASNITAGSIDASRISVTNLNASNITTGNLNATRISGGTLDCSNITVSNLNASSISSGTLSASYISGGTLNCSNITVTNLNVARLNFTSNSTYYANKTFMFADGTYKYVYIGSDNSSYNVDRIYMHTQSGVTIRQRSTDSYGISINTADRSIVPTVDMAWDLGSSNRWFANGYFNNGTIASLTASYIYGRVSGSLTIGRSTDKLGFFGSTPQSRGTVSGSTTDAKLSSLLTLLRSYGLINT